MLAGAQALMAGEGPLSHCLGVEAARAMGDTAREKHRPPLQRQRLQQQLLPQQPPQMGRYLVVVHLGMAHPQGKGVQALQDMVELAPLVAAHRGKGVALHRVEAPPGRGIVGRHMEVVRRRAWVERHIRTQSTSASQVVELRTEVVPRTQGGHIQVGGGRTGLSTPPVGGRRHPCLGAVSATYPQRPGSTDGCPASSGRRVVASPAVLPL